jgi:hypothetical protein
VELAISAGLVTMLRFDSVAALSVKLMKEAHAMSAKKSVIEMAELIGNRLPVSVHYLPDGTALLIRRDIYDQKIVYTIHVKPGILSVTAINDDYLSPGESNVPPSFSITDIALRYDFKVYVHYFINHRDEGNGADSLNAQKRT